jgi:hypothetical protein
MARGKRLERKRVNALGLNNRGLAVYNDDEGPPQARAQGDCGSFNIEQHTSDHRPPGPEGEAPLQYGTGDNNWELTDE